MLNNFVEKRVTAKCKKGKRKKCLCEIRIFCQGIYYRPFTVPSWKQTHSPLSLLIGWLFLQREGDLSSKRWLQRYKPRNARKVKSALISLTDGVDLFIGYIILIPVTVEKWSQLQRKIFFFSDCLNYCYYQTKETIINIGID